MPFDVPVGFRVVAASDYCRAVKDGTHDSPKEVEFGKLLITSKNIKEGRVQKSGAYKVSIEDYEQIIRRSRVDRWDIIFTMIGTVGELALVEEPAPDFAIKNVGLFKTKDELSAKWLYYFLRSPIAREELESRKKGSTQQYISLGELRSFPVLEPEDSQLKTAAVELLSALDNRIDLLRQTNATLESIAQALFKSWFIDFDPVRAKAEGREPEGMDTATAALFPAEFEESAQGLIPRGWQAAAIQDVVENVYDGPHATPPEATEGPVFLGIKNLTGTSIDLGEIRHIAEDDWARWTKRVTPQANDIVFSYEAALGLFALIPPGLRCCLGRRLALVRPKQVAGTPHFWFHQFISAPFQRLLDKHTVQGATVNRIALKEFPSFTVMDPGEQLRTAFEAVTQPLWARIHANRQQALNFAELRDSLLPRLVSGKLQLQGSLPELS